MSGRIFGRKRPECVGPNGMGESKAKAITPPAAYAVSPAAQESSNLLHLECYRSPVKLLGMAVKEAKYLESEDVEVVKVTLTLESEDLVPNELRVLVEDVATLNTELGGRGATKMSVAHPFKRASYLLSNRRPSRPTAEVMFSADVDSAAILINEEWKLQWKVTTWVEVNQTSRLAMMVGNAYTEVTIENIQLELFGADEADDMADDEEEAA